MRRRGNEFHNQADSLMNNIIVIIVYSIYIEVKKKNFQNWIHFYDMDILTLAQGQKLKGKKFYYFSTGHIIWHHYHALISLLLKGRGGGGKKKILLFLLPVLPRQNKSAMVINFKNDIPLTIDCFLRRGRIWIIVNRRRMTMKKT